jgi:hypothetical protein
LNGSETRWRHTDRNFWQYKRGAWVPVKAKRRSTRIRNDGRTSLEKAQDQKKREDLEEACNAGKKRVRNSNSHKFLNIASYVGIDLGEDKEKVEENVNTCMEFDKKRGNKRTPTIEGGGVAVECEMNNKKMGNRKEKEDDEENSADDKKGSLIPPTVFLFFLLSSLFHITNLDSFKHIK